MERVLLEYATQGIFCGLFIYTYLHNQKTNREREERYIDTINRFSLSVDELREVIREGREQDERNRGDGQVPKQHATRA